jgi:hypothetical protein
MNSKWRHNHPYPTNPFERVNGKELEKHHKLNKQAQRQKLPEAPF